MELTITVNKKSCLRECELCKKKDVQLLLYSALPPSIFKKNEKGSCLYVCADCFSKMVKITKFIESKILKQHKIAYIQINEAFLEKENSQIKINTKKEIFITFNPYNIINANNYKKNNKNGFLKKKRCEICGSRKNLTVHHPCKQAIFGKNNERTITLCPKHHKKIERNIKNMENRILIEMKDMYFLIYNLFKMINIENKRIFELYFYEEGDKYIISLKEKRD